MKIAHIGPSNLPILFSQGGAVERRIVELARVQAGQGHEVTVYSAEAHTSESFYHGFRLRTLACRGTSWPRALHFLWQAGRDLEGRPTDLIHFHGMPEGVWFTRTVDAVKFLSYDFFHSRRWDRRPAYDLYRSFIRAYDRLLPVSQFCLETSRAFWKIDVQPMRVLYNGVNLDQFAQDDNAGRARRQHLGLGDAPVVLYVGRVCEQKGTDVLIDAFDRLKHRLHDVQLVVAGPAGQFGNTEPSALTERIKQVGGRYLGAVDEADLAATYNLASVYVMPTRRDEMFGMAAAEAQACGKPVICSRQGGLPEVVPETSGLHFPTGDAAALATQLERLLLDRELYERLVARARPNAERFSWSAINDECLRLFREVQAERQSDRRSQTNPMR